VCSGCDHKCATCGNKNSSYCLSCPPELFYVPSANDCVVSCGIGQAMRNATDGSHECIDCVSGCAKCLDGLPDICTKCKPGLVNFNFTTCLTECPTGFVLNKRSGDCLDTAIRCPYGYELNETNQCELAVQQCLPGYVLNGYLNRCIPVPGLWIPFPTLGLLAVIYFLVYIRARCCQRDPQTKMVPTILAFWSLVELPLFVAQAFYAAQIQHWVTLGLTGLAIVFHMGLNCYAAKLLVPESLFAHDDALSHSEIAKNEQSLDFAFKHWALEHGRTLKSLRCIGLYYNHKVLRLLQSNFLGKQKYQAVFDRPDLHFHRPMLRLAVVNMVLSYSLIVIADVFALRTIVQWGYQFIIFCVESLVFVVLMSVLEVVDYW
jgi:hypothetical protein